MCGLAGVVCKDKDRKVSPQLLKVMGDSILHRGPDDEGYLCQANIGLAFRRLSIIDLSTGHQPFSNLNGTVHVVFNGEIYNFLELKRTLEKKGYQFRSSSDTEVILNLYIEYGTRCLEFLRGMFAFAIWDANEQTLFCARDRFGIKPFYYYEDNEQFIFASEIKAILQNEQIDKTICPKAMDSYFAFGYITSDLSIYTHIKKLLPGHYLLLSLNKNIKSEIHKYWDISFQPDYSKSEQYWINEVHETLSETVKLHMISDVPLGAFLSGGIDSSSIVALMAQHSSAPIKTFSIGFKDLEISELNYARQIAKQYNCDHNELIVEPESINLLPKLVKAYDEPFADTSIIPTYYVSKLARESVKVVLSGDGGDELFAGYNGYTKFKNIYSLPISFKNARLNKAIWGSLHSSMPQAMVGKGFMYYLSLNKQYAYAYQSTWTPDERRRLLHKELLNGSTGSAEKFKEIILKNNEPYDLITNFQYLDIKTYMVDSVLTKVDRASMINSLEVRVPFLDHKFAELSARIPSEFKLKNKEKKYILKKSMEKHLPENILYRPKQGFGVPLNSWFKEDLQEYVEDTLLQRNSVLTNFVDKNYVKKLVIDERKGKRDLNYKIWSLIIFQEWLKNND